MTTEKYVLPSEISSLLKKPMEVKKANFVGGCQSSPSGYSHEFTSYHTPSMLEIANKADQKLEEAWKKSQDQHAENLPAIENNREMARVLTAIMEAAGVKAAYSVHDFPTPRSRYKKQFTKHAGYPSDISRSFPVNDEFGSAEQTYKQLKEKYAAYRKEAEREGEKAKRAADAEVTKRRADMDLARLLVKYGLEATHDWSDVLDEIRKRDQYLDLAIAGRQTRGDWSEGYYRVQHAFDRFRIKDDRDKDIAADIMGCLASGSEGDIDGRIFRDTKWNYDALFTIVSDQSLVDDANICLNHIQE